MHPSSSSSPALSKFAVLTASSAFFLLIAGGMVTSTGSGLAVPDWPLSYGQYFPPMKGGVFFEHGHRMIAGTVASLTWVLAAWIWLREKRPGLRRWAAAAAFGILLQAALGGITVLYGLLPQISIAHACLGQALFCILVGLAEALRRPGRADAVSGPWRLGAFAIGALYFQLILGAVLRHTGWGVAFHLAGAGLAVAAVGLVVRRSLALAEDPALRAPAYWLLGLIGLQLALGLGALLARTHRLVSWMAALPTAHVACGALLLAFAVVWTLRARRPA